MTRGQFDGASSYIFPTPEAHKKMALRLMGDGYTLADVTRAFTKLFLSDAEFREKVYNSVQKKGSTAIK